VVWSNRRCQGNSIFHYFTIYDYY